MPVSTVPDSSTLESVTLTFTFDRPGSLCRALSTWERGSRLEALLVPAVPLVAPVAAPTLPDVEVLGVDSGCCCELVEPATPPVVEDWLLPVVAPTLPLEELGAEVDGCCCEVVAPAIPPVDSGVVGAAPVLAPPLPAVEEEAPAPGVVPVVVPATPPVWDEVEGLVAEELASEPVVPADAALDWLADGCAAVPGSVSCCCSALCCDFLWCLFFFVFFLLFLRVGVCWLVSVPLWLEVVVCSLLCEPELEEGADWLSCAMAYVNVNANNSATV